MSPCSLGAVPTGFGTGVEVRPAGWRPGQSCVWILAWAPRGQRSQKDVSAGKGRPMPFWARGAAEATARGLRPVDSGLGFPSVPRWSQAVWRPAQESQGHGPGGGRQRPPSRAPSSSFYREHAWGCSRPLVAASCQRPPWPRFPSFTVSSSHPCLHHSSLSHLPSTPTPCRSNPSGFQRAP